MYEEALLTLILLFQQEGLIQLWLSHFVGDLHLKGVADRHLPANLLPQQAAIHSARAFAKAIGSNSHKVVTDVDEDKLQNTRELQRSRIPETSEQQRVVDEAISVEQGLPQVHQDYSPCQDHYMGTFTSSFVCQGACRMKMEE